MRQNKMRNTLKITAAMAALMMSMSVSVSALDLPFIPVDPDPGQTDPAPVITPTDPTPVIVPEELPIIPADTSVPVTTAPSVTYSYDIPAANYDYVYSYIPEPSYADVNADVSKKAELRISGHTDENGCIVLEWDKVKKAEKYTVYLLSGKKYSKIGETKSTSYTYKKAQKGKTYKFMVRYVIGGRSSGTDESYKITVKAEGASGKPRVSVTSANGKASLKWNAVEGAKKYAIYRYSNGKLKKVGETKKTSAKLTVKKGDTGYAVKAYVNGKWTTLTKNDITEI